MEGHIDIHGEIGTRVTLQSVKAQTSPSYTSYIVHLASEGGDVYEGIKIYHAIKALPNVTVVVEGLAASIATLIMQAGKRIIALKPSDIMIHNPWGQIQGEADDFIAAAEQLNRIKSTLISIYKPRLKKSETEIAAMMDNETWMSAEEAMAAGLVDEVQERLKAVAKLDFKKFKNDSMENKLVEKFNALLKSLDAGIKAAFNPKAMAEVTLEDGTVAMIDTEDPSDIQGKGITVNGEPVPDGQHKLADGRTITVAGGVITAVGSAEAKKPDDMEALKKENEELKSKLAAMESAKAEADKTVQSQNRKINEMSTTFKNLKKEVEDLRNATAGVEEAPVADPDAEAARNRQQVEVDPMFAAFAKDVQGIFKDKKIRMQ